MRCVARHDAHLGYMVVKARRMTEVRRSTDLSISVTAAEPLALGEEVGVSVLELLANEGAAAAVTRLPVAAIGVEAVGEIPSLAIHIHVLRVERCPALGEGLLEHETNRPEQLAQLPR